MSQHDIDFTSFPSTRYQGSKRKILPWIFKYLKDIKFNSVLDVFGGTASVSYLFKKMGKTVFYNDYLKFNYIIGKALIENSNVLIEPDDLKKLFQIKGCKSPTFIQKTFKDFYFTDSENHWLDLITNKIHNLKSYPPEILEYKKSILFYALFQTCLVKRPFNLFHRKNLYLRTNNVSRSFGNSSTWEKSFKEHFIKFSNEINKVIFDNHNQCKSLNSSVFELNDLGTELVYLDPPYFRIKGTNETSNYLNIYHFLEGISKYNEWKNLIDYDAFNLRFKNDLIDNFDKSNIKENLELIFDKYRKSIIVLSYKKGGIPSIEYTKNLLNKFKKRTYTRSIHYKYALNHQNGDAINNREVLIIGI
jgi:adenine-specific DNA-methyltransferase